MCVHLSHSPNPDDKWQFLARIQSLTHIPALNWCHTVAYLNANEGPAYCTNVDFPTPIVYWLCVASVVVWISLDVRRASECVVVFIASPQVEVTGKIFINFLLAIRYRHFSDGIWYAFCKGKTNAFRSNFNAMNLRVRAYARVCVHVFANKCDERQYTRVRCTHKSILH